MPAGARPHTSPVRRDEDGGDDVYLSPAAVPRSAVGTTVSADATSSLLDAYGLPTETSPLTSRWWKIDTGDVRVLVDTGTGQGEALGTLSTLGIAPGSIDGVVISHFHGDHIGGLAPPPTCVSGTVSRGRA